MPHDRPNSNQQSPRTDYSRLRRVIIEERQAKTIEHVRTSRGYADDVSLHAHDQQTFRLINQRKQLDELPLAGFVVPTLDEWKHWTKMGDWDSRNRLLEDLTNKLRRREATSAEIEVLIVVCRPQWRKVAASLRRYGGADLDAGADGQHRREEARRVNELDRAELDQVIQHGLLDALAGCPRPFPRYFFPWLEKVLLQRALDHVQRDVGEHPTGLPNDAGIEAVVNAVLADEVGPAASSFRAPASPAHSQWLRTLDLPAMFELSDEYATYARARSACERAVDRLPNRQREVIQGRYFEAITQASLATQYRVTSSSIRSSHAGALKNLRRDNDLFDVLEAVGKVRDRDRRRQLERDRRAA